MEGVSVDNCLILREYCQRYRLEEVQVKVEEVIENNLVAVLRQEEFKELDVHNMTAILGKRRSRVGVFL